MADFNHVKIKDEDSNMVSSTLGTTGTLMAQKRLLSQDGANAVGNGQWYRSNGFWKTVMLYVNDRKTAIAAGVVQIDACMELASAPDDPDADTQYVTIATLDSTTKHFSTEAPWRYLRARVTTANIVPIQVGIFEQGQG
jgi:hypothetical protein